ncbi:DegV family protein [Roseburia sp. MSJ-14]|uniref:DegV family protein n=1 Tax=Roseburia sp. MSJ-14 TaxID=2841514 RepID=UPI001C120226|nr:DegV family protein [Roseburia sp. MSJ-14]MBU5473747.1 DegV family protein [Roseburia sp. MSJ-14]
MSYKIVVDSCGELPEKLKEDGHFQTVSLELFVDDYHVTDDEHFNQKEFLRKVKESPNCPKSACPSPEAFQEAYDCEADHVYAVTLSAQLSGSYNSAELGKNLYLEEKGEKKIHVFDSKSASIGETLIAMKIQEYEEAGCSFEEVVAKVDAYIAEQNTYFVLETLETLRKNGRLSNIKAFVASALNIKPVMGSTSEGSICQLSQARGMGKALDKMITTLLSRVKNPEQKILAISHCNCPERAQTILEKVKSLGKFKDVFVIDTAGISSMYANDGGVIMAV